jgi:hypothetical protein
VVCGWCVFFHWVRGLVVFLNSYGYVGGCKSEAARW